MSDQPPLPIIAAMQQHIEWWERTRQWVSEISTQPDHRNASPKRRRIVDGDPVGEDDGIDQTPTSRGPQDASILDSRLVLRPSSSAISSRRFSQHSTPSRRSSSPIKKTQNLRILEKPVRYVLFGNIPTKQLPPDVVPLYRRIYAITVGHDAFLPHNARDEIWSTTGGEGLTESWFTRPKISEDGVQNEGHHLSQSDALAELQALEKIGTKAHDCTNLGRSEFAWNVDVHGPLLELALSRYPYIVKEVVTTAQIASPFIPPTSGRGDPVSGKMVDFALVLAPDGNTASDSDKQLAKSISEAVLSQPGFSQCVNQTQYLPLQFRPIAVSIETKAASGLAEEGRVQLAVWVAAWHQRMKTFLNSGTAKPTDGEGRIITLPLLLVVEHEWKLLFACDRGDRLELVGDMSVGDTKNIIGLYTITAVLQELAKWSGSTFREWITDVFVEPVGPTLA